MMLRLSELRPKLRQGFGWAAWLGFLVALDTNHPDWLPVWAWVISRVFYLGAAVYFAIHWWRFRRPIHIDADNVTDITIRYTDGHVARYARSAVSQPASDGEDAGSQPADKGEDA